MPSMLPSFPALRERNLRILYGDTKINDYIGNDRSPKGNVDEKIRPLVDLINRHQEYVTLSSCSGRVALFDPAGTTHAANTSIIDRTNNNPISEQQIKGTQQSGKGRGKWIFVTHDILPDLGPQIIESLIAIGQERYLRRQSSTENTIDEPPITFKHEPPLLHVAAASLEAGKKLLHIAKSVCAMRESGLVVTDQRVTVELRTTGTLLCLPLMVQPESFAVSLVPSEEYLLSLAENANERMVQNELLLEKLFATIQEELFEKRIDQNTAKMTTSYEETGNKEYKVNMQPMPPLNLWKTAAVAIPRNGDDLDVLAFGGEGIGPTIDGVTNSPTCRRWDTVFRLRRRAGIWSNHWDTIPIPVGSNGSTETTNLVTNAGSFHVHLSNSLGPREGHCACILPQLETDANPSWLRSIRVIIFGGRTGGPMSPSNDLFLFGFATEEIGIIGRPSDIRGAPPEPRFGHSMTSLRHEEHLSVVAGGTGISSSGGTISLSSVHILSRIIDNETCIFHFSWERVSDMPRPRTYHTSFIEDNSNCMYVFGGIAEADDPLNPVDSQWFKLPLFANVANDSQHENDCTSIIEQTPLIGSSAATFSLRSGMMVLCVGGAKSSITSDLGHDAEETLNILTFQSDKDTAQPALSRAPISSIELVNSGDNNSSDTVDLGSCVHHCLVALPMQKDASSSTETVSAIIVGGGVPSFSFGQSYARSYLINVTMPSVKCRKEHSKPSQHHINNNLSQNQFSAPQRQQINGKPMVKVDVIYIAARHAKEVKNELELLGLLDKRYKMVKVDSISSKEADGCLGDRADNLVAIPVTKQCTGPETISRLVIGRGTEMVPFSSSSMGKMKQGKKV